MGAVVVSENFGMFEELIAGEALLKFGPGDEAIVLSLDLISARSAGGVGDRKGQFFDFVHEA